MKQAPKNIKILVNILKLSKYDVTDKFNPSPVQLMNIINYSIGKVRNSVNPFDYIFSLVVILFVRTR